MTQEMTKSEDIKAERSSKQNFDQEQLEVEKHVTLLMG